MNILARLEKSRETWFLLIIAVIFFFLRFPSLFEPDWYGDEGVYQTVGMGINAGRLLYKGIFDNKPPFLYVLYSLVSSDMFLIRLLSLIFGLLSVLLFFYLAKKLFNSRKITYISTFVFAVLFGLPLIEGNIANAENFMLLPNILAAILVLKSIEAKTITAKNKILLISGFILGLSFLFKVVAVFDFAAFFAFLFVINYKGKFKEIFDIKTIYKEALKSIFLIIGFLIPPILTAIYFIANNAFSDFITATFFSNIGYVGYGNKFIIPQGLLIIKLVILAAFCLFIFYKRKNLDQTFIFGSFWLAFSLFDTFFSQRPYTHYLLVLLPSFCLMVGFSMLNKKFSRLSVLLSIVTLIVVIANFSFYGKTVFYYQNFLSFITGSKSVTSYQKFFDGSTPTNYEIAAFINMHTNKSDGLFVWGNNAQLYKLTDKLPPGKYTVEYHITNYKDGYSNTENALKEENPKFIVVMPNVETYPFSLSGYGLSINMEGVEIYEKIH